MYAHHVLEDSAVIHRSDEHQLRGKLLPIAFIYMSLKEKLDGIDAPVEIHHHAKVNHHDISAVSMS